MHSGIEFIDAFGSAFTAALARERPANSANEYVFAPKGARVQDGMIVRVVPRAARPWYGMFSDGIPIFSPAASGIFGTPDPNKLFVASHGNGYLVDVRSPASAEIVMTQLSYVLPVPDVEMLVVADNEAFFGIAGNAIRWEQDFEADGFSNLNAASGFVTALVNRPGRGKIKISLDASTGQVVEEDAIV